VCSSDLGKEYLNAIAKELVVTQTKDSLRITRFTSIGDGKTTLSDEVFSLNGKETISMTTTKRKRISSINFDKNKNLATITTILSYPDKYEEAQFKNTELWSISKDGTLTIVKTSDATQTDDWTIKALFKKQ
jgi:hypothetical protein